MKKIALFLSGVHDLRGGGGAERFFADFFSIYKSWPEKKFEIYFFLDDSTLGSFQGVCKLIEKENVILLKNHSNRFKRQLENVDLKRNLKKYKIDIFHCVNFGRQDFNRLNFISINTNVKTILNIVDCQIPYVLIDKNDSRYNVFHEKYVTMPCRIKFNGVFSWYKKFIDYINEEKLYEWQPLMKNIHSRFADVKKFIPSINKENTIVFASRMHFQKKPDWFLQAILILKDNYPDLIKNWNFLFVGDGDLSNDMESFIVDNNLSKTVEKVFSYDLSEIYPKTSCYVSTQDYENFPSLSMMEAMSCANSIIARNVGQTNLMVKNKVNGLIFEEDSPMGLAMTIKKYIELGDDVRSSMQNESLKMVQEVHTPREFIKQIEEFWINL